MKIHDKRFQEGDEVVLRVAPGDEKLDGNTDFTPGDIYLVHQTDYTSKEFKTEYLAVLLKDDNGEYWWVNHDAVSLYIRPKKIFVKELE